MKGRRRYPVRNARLGGRLRRKGLSVLANYNSRDPQLVKVMRAFGLLTGAR